MTGLNLSTTRLSKDNHKRLGCCSTFLTSNDWNALPQYIAKAEPFSMICTINWEFKYISIILYSFHCKYILLIVPDPLPR